MTLAQLKLRILQCAGLARWPIGTDSVSAVRLAIHQTFANIDFKVGGCWLVARLDFYFTGSIT